MDVMPNTRHFPSHTASHLRIARRGMLTASESTMACGIAHDLQQAASLGP